MRHLNITVGRRAHSFIVTSIVACGGLPLPRGL